VVLDVWYNERLPQLKDDYNNANTQKKCLYKYAMHVRSSTHNIWQYVYLMINETMIKYQYVSSTTRSERCQRTTFTW